MKGSDSKMGWRNGPEKADAEARKPEAVVELGGSGGEKEVRGRAMSSRLEYSSGRGVGVERRAR